MSGNVNKIRSPSYLLNIENVCKQLQKYTLCSFSAHEIYHSMANELINAHIQIYIIYIIQIFVNIKVSEFDIITYDGDYIKT